MVYSKHTDSQQRQNCQREQPLLPLLSPWTRLSCLSSAETSLHGQSTSLSGLSQRQFVRRFLHVQQSLLDTYLFLNSQTFCQRNIWTKRRRFFTTACAFYLSHLSRPASWGSTCFALMASFIMYTPSWRPTLRTILSSV
jgi:hypothetical protein